LQGYAVCPDNNRGENEAYVFSEKGTKLFQSGTESSASWKIIHERIAFS
jgi:hypothetical protein